ncbi:MAG: L-threonylcarbamoyladenylate synthase type 1 TsaC, partial [Oxalobacteraceae bacterium]
VVYRLGGMALDQIETVVGPVDVRSHSTSNPKAPGMLSSHYAPRVPLILLPTGSNPAPSTRAGALAFRQPFSGIPAAQQRILSETGDLTEAAQNLFAYLRQLDALDLDLLYAEAVPAQGLGAAINDRLRRASVH